MALMSELVELCERHNVDKASTLSVFARRLREAGRVSKAGRGRGAAHMTFLDAARFLIACAATDHPEKAADSEFVFSNLVLSSSGSVNAEIDPKIEGAETLDACLSATLELIANGKILERAKADWKEKLETLSGGPVNFHAFIVIHRSHVGAQMRVLGSQLFFYHPALIDVMKAGDEGGYPAQKPFLKAFERETHRFRSGKNLTAEFEMELLKAVADLIAGNET
ncbi:MAG: hypothetical protein JJ866_13020 [Roseibium sp.]|uniref:hypothetical protein n=1 Tax=Roseibium sp. TaxID=1936156 RepID=UPI001B1CEF0E|nr:hypothetical protein [Roseibium sp.]MBO6892857.1 hypothetical protein [Roseibium sp.]MBO6927958.1 hypothetical protein [Roseibium sp.]